MQFNFIFSGANEVKVELNPNTVCCIIDHANNSFIFSVANSNIPAVCVPIVDISFNAQLGIMDITTEAQIRQSIIDGINNLNKYSIK